MKTIQIEIPEGKRAEWVNGVLTLVDEKPKDITERIKTFEDAVEWCYKNGKEYLVRNYEGFVITYSASDISAADILAYLKLRIITCALNEGWEPRPYQNDMRYYAVMNDQCTDIVRVVAATATGASTPHTLYFKTKELALYAASQFKDIYMDFCKGKELGMGAGFITGVLFLIYWELSNIAKELKKMNNKRKE